MQPMTEGPHIEYCRQLGDELSERDTLVENYRRRMQASSESEQVTFNSAADVESIYGELPHLYQSNCAHKDLPSMMPDSGDYTDPRHALLQFMIAATPNEELASNIKDQYEAYLQKMIISSEHHFVGDHAATAAVIIDNVPDAVAPVKAKPVYVQVPDGDKTSLMMSWRVCLLPFRPDL